MHSKGKRVKIPLLTNKVGKRSGTMTLVTSHNKLNFLVEIHNNFITLWASTKRLHFEG